MTTQIATITRAIAVLCNTNASAFTVRKQELVAKVAMIDLGPIKFKLAHEDGISSAQLEIMEDLYRKYLVLIELHPNETIVPTKFIDQMWHAHILDTVKYRTDCETTFGHFIDHFPYLGLRGVEDASKLASSFESTQQLFFNAFGVDLKGEASRCEGTECGGTACGKSNCNKGTYGERPSLN